MKLKSSVFIILSSVFLMQSVSVYSAGNFGRRASGMFLRKAPQIFAAASAVGASGMGYSAYLFNRKLQEAKEEITSLHSEVDVLERQNHLQSLQLKVDTQGLRLPSKEDFLQKVEESFKTLNAEESKILAEKIFTNLQETLGNGCFSARELMHQILFAEGILRRAISKEEGDSSPKLEKLTKGFDNLIYAVVGKSLAPYLDLDAERIIISRTLEDS